MKNIQAFKTLIDRPQNVVIVTHFKPDADALGSSLGLAGFLKKKGHKVQVITPSDYPEFLAWMPGNEHVIAYDKKVAAQVAAHIEAATVIFCLDFSNLSRINDMGELIRNSKATKVLIDHHLEPEQFAEFEQWDVTSASTAGLIFELIEQLGEAHQVDTNIASCLYAGLMTDTGGFRHNNTHHREFLIASKLVGHGANPHEIAKDVYDTNTLERLRLTGYVLSQKLNVIPEYRTAYMTLSQDELKQFGAQTGDTEGLVNYGLSIKGVKLSVLMYDRKEEIKLSFRSLEDFSVNEMARKYFQGGGHRNASGGTTRMSLEQTLKKFLEILPEYKEQLQK
ncbi:MAG TPA: bifunctional oligoribonuclease/PAP phosphatase NrnA [Cyclobacteriaceae bacterium]|nr:bifunctional oligoribonuclease/PAP phosphatase NrnA [Cyclobacteriaceae bacterium]